MEPTDPSAELVRVAPASRMDAGGVAASDGFFLVLRGNMERLRDGDVLEISGALAGLQDDLTSWCRVAGHTLLAVLDGHAGVNFLVRKGLGGQSKVPDWGLRIPQREGRLDVRDWLLGQAGEVPENANVYLGFVPRGAVPEAGAPAFPYTINSKSEVWADNVADLYELGKTQAWNPATDIRWAALPELPEATERAVCQTMTFLAENEYSALYIPAKFLPRINAQFVEPVLFLASVIQEEARHIEAFTKRAMANGGGLQRAASLTEWSLHSLLLEEDYFRSSFLLHVLGEGTFLDLLHHIEMFSPDPVTQDIVRRARMDEGRHVAYGLAHARYQLQRAPTKAEDLVVAAQQRANALQHTSDDNPALLEALATLAGGGGSPRQVTAGMDHVRSLFQEMHENRVRRMLQIGLSKSVAEKISEEHTPNFM